jgi:hypothetical protein
MLRPVFVDGTGYLKNTKGDVITSPFNNNIDFSYIQLNHYKCKTFEEYKYIRTRGLADGFIDIKKHLENLEEDFNHYDINEIEDLTAKNFYQNVLISQPQ